MSRRLAVVLVPAAFILAAAVSVPAAPAIAAAAARFHVEVGFEEIAQGLEAEALFPNSLTVNVGDLE